MEKSFQRFTVYNGLDTRRNGSTAKTPSSRSVERWSVYRALIMCGCTMTAAWLVDAAGRKRCAVGKLERWLGASLCPVPPITTQLLQHSDTLSQSFEAIESRQYRIHVIIP